MQRKRRRRVGWVMESVLIALCLAIFGALLACDGLSGN